MFEDYESQIAEDLKVGDTLEGEEIIAIVPSTTSHWIRFTTRAHFGERIQDIESWQDVRP